MAFILRLFISLLTGALGVALITHSFQITQLFGHADLAERYLGTGGTYTMWKLIGLALIIGAVWYLFIR